MPVFQPQIAGEGGGKYIAGTGINIDEETKEISVVDPVLVNESPLEGAVQIGRYELLDSNGIIPEARLADTTSAVQGQILTLDINNNAIWADPDVLPASTKYGASLSLSIDSSNYVVTAQLKDQDGNNLGNPQTIDLPLESVVVSGRYDESTKKVILTLQNGSTVEFIISDFIDGLQNQIQFSTMPTATIDTVNKIVQYVGETTEDYTKGYFYECVPTSEHTPQVPNLCWQQIDVMPAGSSLPDQTGNAGKYLKTDGTNASWETVSGGGGAVNSVNGKTGDVVLFAEDVNSIPQYSELPEPTIDNVYTVAQYVGDTDETYTNGYFYKNNDTEEPAYAEAWGDPCYGEITVDVDTFEPIVNLSDGEETTFTWVVEHSYLDYSIIQGDDFDVYIWDPEMSGEDYEYFITNIAGEYDESYNNTYYVYIGNDTWDCFKENNTNFGTVSTWDFGSAGIDVYPYEESFQEGDKFSLSKSGEYIDRWERDGVPVEDEGYYSPWEYGISWTGCDEENTSITVVYHEEQIVYEWQRVDVQPQPVINYPVTSVNNQTGAVNITAAGIGATTKTARTATLYSNAWTEGSNHNKQTISVSGVTTNNTILVAPNSTDEGVSQAVWSKSGVLCVAQSNNSLTFMYDSTKSAPNTNIDVNIVILN